MLLFVACHQKSCKLVYRVLVDPLCYKIYQIHFKLYGLCLSSFFGHILLIMVGYISESVMTTS